MQTNLIFCKTSFIQSFTSVRPPSDVSTHQYWICLWAANKKMPYIELLHKGHKYHFVCVQFITQWICYLVWCSKNNVWFKICCMCGPLHEDEQGLGDLLEPIHNISVLIQIVAWKTCWDWWMVEMSNEKGSGKSVLVHNMMMMTFILSSYLLRKVLIR